MKNLGKILKKIIKQIVLIANGIRNYFFKNSRIENLAKQRMDICNACPEIDLKGDKCFAPNTQPCCGKCGCKLAFATRSEDYKCPLNKW